MSPTSVVETSTSFMVLLHEEMANKLKQLTFQHMPCCYLPISLSDRHSIWPPQPVHSHQITAMRHCGARKFFRPTFLTVRKPIGPSSNDSQTHREHQSGMGSSSGWSHTLIEIVTIPAHALVEKHGLHLSTGTQSGHLSQLESHRLTRDIATQVTFQQQQT